MPRNLPAGRLGSRARTWRHLDLMQFETILRARVPRSDCPSCGVKTTTVPWAG
ncbi:MAG: transposase family protein [Planctomycetota bacterium]